MCRKTQSPLMSSLPENQRVRYDGPVGKPRWRSGFLPHSSIVASPITPNTQSLRWRLISGSLCVCSFSAPHAGITFDTFQPQSIASRSSTQASRFFLAGDFWFPFLQLGRSRKVNAPVLPIVQEILQSHSLVFRNPPDLPTHRCGAALDIILSSPSLSACVTVHSGSNCCSLAPLCCPLLSSDQLCSCRLDIHQASLSPLFSPFAPTPCARLVHCGCCLPSQSLCLTQVRLGPRLWPTP